MSGNGLDDNGSGPEGLAPDRWVESAYENLRYWVSASEPVGCEETGYLVEFDIDYDLEQWALVISPSR